MIAIIASLSSLAVISGMFYYFAPANAAEKSGATVTATTTTEPVYIGEIATFDLSKLRSVTVNATRPEKKASPLVHELENQILSRRKFIR